MCPGSALGLRFWQTLEGLTMEPYFSRCCHTTVQGLFLGF